MTLLLALLVACNGSVDTAVELPPVTPGAPVAGAAEGRLELPIGVPLGCYTARCWCMGGVSSPDDREGPYNTAFDVSAGIHTRPVIKVIWLENGDDHLVLIKSDLCMSSDKVIAEVTRRLEAETGLDLEGKVTFSVNHSHSSYGGYQDAWHWYLGTDAYNEEVFQRMSSQIADVALDAWQTRVPARIGTGWAEDWDPDDRVYRDRRDENDELAVWDDAEPGYGKDPYVNVLRVDTLDGEPIAAAFTFGMHGIIGGADNPMVSSDAGGGLESVVQESFDRPVVVMHLQGAGGDASPGGRDRGFARMESIGELAKDALLDVWSRTPTSADPIRLQTASRHIWQHHSQIRVTRDGTVDWYYAPLGENPRPDDVVYDDNGDIVSPIDEFEAPYGAAFCGGGGALLADSDIGSEVYPYASCTDVEAMGGFVQGVFGFDESEDVPLPFPETYKAGTTASRIGPLPTLLPDGTEAARELFVGFFPGEPTGMYAEQWRRRVADELGYEMPLLVGYAQDHEGYLLIPEDWLLGGYEPNINVWGPLQGEHIMEGVLDYGQSVLSQDVHVDPDPAGLFAPTEYAAQSLPTLSPDPSPRLGEILTEAPEHLWVPEDIPLDLAVPAQVRRVQDVVQFAWIGGDPMVDPPHVLLERQVDGNWEQVTTPSGRPVTEAMTDLLVGHTPDPLGPPDAQQDHLYWTAWQPVAHAGDRLDLPVGTYRLRVEGRHYVGDDATWPWATEDYEVTFPSFEVVPADVSVELGEGGVWAWIDAPAHGWRLVDLDGDSRGKNPLRGTVTVELFVDDAVESFEVEVDQISGGRAWLPFDRTGAASITVTDAFGNTGGIALN